MRTDHAYERMPKGIGRGTNKTSKSTSTCWMEIDVICMQGKRDQQHENATYKLVKHEKNTLNQTEFFVLSRISVGPQSAITISTRPSHEPTLVSIIYMWCHHRHLHPSINNWFVLRNQSNSNHCTHAIVCQAVLGWIVCTILNVHPFICKHLQTCTYRRYLNAEIWRCFLRHLKLDARWHSHHISLI